MANPLVLIHGYGSGGAAFSIWKDALLKAGRKIEEISIGNYVTLNNEVTVDDIANGLQQAIRRASTRRRSMPLFTRPGCWLFGRG